MEKTLKEQFDTVVAIFNANDSCIVTDKGDLYADIPRTPAQPVESSETKNG